MVMILHVRTSLFKLTTSTTAVTAASATAALAAVTTSVFAP